MGEIGTDRNGVVGDKVDGMGGRVGWIERWEVV
jgi:hypothetical protein